VTTGERCRQEYYLANGGVDRTNYLANRGGDMEYHLADRGGDRVDDVAEGGGDREYCLADRGGDRVDDVAEEGGDREYHLLADRGGDRVGDVAEGGGDREYHHLADGGGDRVDDVAEGGEDREYHLLADGGGDRVDDVAEGGGDREYHHLADRGGDRVDDVAEDLLDAGQVVGHRSQLTVKGRALHHVTSFCGSAQTGGPGDGLHVDRLAKLLGHHEAHGSIGEGEQDVGDALEALGRAVALAHEPLHAPRVLLGLVCSPGGYAFDNTSLSLFTDDSGQEGLFFGVDHLQPLVGSSCIPLGDDGGDKAGDED